MAWVASEMIFHRIMGAGDSLIGIVNKLSNRQLNVMVTLQDIPGARRDAVHRGCGPPGHLPNSNRAKPWLPSRAFLRQQLLFACLAMGTQQLNHVAEHALMMRRCLPCLP